MRHTDAGDAARQEVLTFLQTFRDERGYLPLINEIARGTQMYRNNVKFHLERLRELGKVDFVSDTDESHDSSKTLRAMGSVDAPMDPRGSICKDLPPVQLPARAEPVGRHTLTPSPSPSPARAPADPNRAEQLLGAIQQGALRPTLRNGRRSQSQPARPPPPQGGSGLCGVGC